MAALRALGIHAVPGWHLPARLCAARPPPLLFVRGDPGLLERPAVGVVGSRRASPAGCRWARARAIQAVHAGRVVVSGGAMGIDAAAHRGAIAGGGQTVAYLGVSADAIYPAGHRRLFLEILKRGGALVSEHAPGERTFPWAHAARNRFIAAQGSALYVAEAAEGSGSLGTAHWARRVGVPTWVSPPGVGRRREGLEWLVAQGYARWLGS